MASGRLWNSGEIELALQLYLRTPFGRIHQGNAEIKELAERLGRTPGSIALKMANLASIDESIPQKGMGNAGKLDRAVWNNFFAKISEGISPVAPDAFSIDAVTDSQLDNYVAPPPSAGNTVERLTSARIGQNWFRQIVLASYDNRCAITGIGQQDLLIASHIKPWSAFPEQRVNPRNGICLNRLHDRAFEAHFMAIEDDGSILYSKQLETKTRDKLMRMNESGRMQFPTRFRPDPAFLAEHRANFRE